MRTWTEKSPLLVRLLHAALYLTTLREWYIRRALNGILEEFAGKASVLDAGSGYGRYSFFLASRYPQVHITALELAEDKVEFGRKLAQRMGLHHLVFSGGDLVHLSSQESFDLILCSDVLEHIQEDMKVLRHFHYGLKRGGYLLIHVPARPLWFAGTSQKNEVHGREYGHVRDYEPGDILEKVREAGFSIEKATITYGFFGALSYRVWKTFYDSSIFKYIFPLYFLLIYPFVFLLMCIDFFTSKEKGNGILIQARKSAA